VCSRRSRIALLTLVGIIFLCPVGQLHAQAWGFPAWAYRVPVTITNVGGTPLTNFQVNIQLINTFNFGGALANGADLRATAGDGVTAIPLWIESWSPPTSASIWVQVASIPVSGSTVYLYYGNPSATSVSSGSATFAFFDDFSYSLPATSFINKALAWEANAQDVTGNGGVSYWYQTNSRLWAGQTYREVTGYTIPTMYDAAAATSDPNLAANLRTRAGQMADFEVASQYADGSWGYIFDTGQVLEGLVRAYRETGNVQYLNSATRAGDWLVSQQAADGSWPHDFGGFGKAYDARVSRSVVMLWQVTGTQTYKTAAVNNLNWDVSQQQPNGWFQNAGINSTAENTTPLTHTIAYTMEGLLDSGIILNNPVYINAAKKAADALLGLQLASGPLSGGTYGSDWTPGTQQQCVTGDAQTALVWLKYYQYTVNQGAPNPQYLNAAHKLNQYLVGVQGNSSDPGVNGGLAGSDPLAGFYRTNQILSWATKFFLDSLLLENKLSAGPLSFYALDPNKWSLPMGPGGFFNGGGVLQYLGLQSGSGPRALAMNGGANVAFGDGIVEYSLQGNGGFDELGLVYRGQNPETSNSYVFYPSTWGAQNDWLSAKLLNGNSVPLGSGGSFNPGVSYPVKAVISGSSHTFFVNGVQVLTTADSSFASGSVGFLAWGNTAESIGSFRIRQYAVADPSTSVGSQQSSGPSITSLTVSPTSIAGGNSVTGTVSLNVTTGGTVTLSSSNTSLATTPSSVQVQSGSYSANFTVTTLTTSSSSPVVISASFASTTGQANLFVTVGVSAIGLNPPSLVGGNASTGTVTLTGPAPSGGALVALSSSNIATATVPVSVLVPAGATSVNFNVATSGVASSQNANITGAYNGSSGSATLTVNPAALSTLTLNPASVVGGSPSTGTITLTGAAPPGGAMISVSSSNTAAATVPSPVTVNAGSTQANFQVTTNMVSGNTSSVIAATYLGQNSNSTLQIIQSSWFGAGWAYRRSITVSNPTGSTLNDFQIHVMLDSTFSFANAQNGGGDIRFTLGDGTTQVPYWIENWTSGSQASIWVRTPSIPPAGTTLFMYYGNPSAASVSDGNGTFYFFDDFSYTSGGSPAIDPSKWSFPAGPYGFSNAGGMLQYSGSVGAGPRALAMSGGSTITFTDGIVEYSLQGNGGFDEVGLVFRGQNPEVANSYVFYPSIWNSQNTWSLYSRLSGIETYINRGGSFTPGVWYGVKAAIGGSSYAFSINGVPVVTATDTSFTSGTVGVFAWGNATDLVKNFRIRKYAATEPATVVGGETGQQ